MRTSAIHAQRFLTSRVRSKALCKIVGTVGPSSEDMETLQSVVGAG